MASSSSSSPQSGTCLNFITHLLQAFIDTVIKVLFNEENPEEVEQLPLPQSIASSSSSGQEKHQVFLSFRGEDTRLNFTAHLLKELKATGMNVFFDEDTLEKGQQLSPALSQGIAASNLSIIVLSSDYASSKSCLAELSDIMHRKETHGHTVLPIFYQVDPSHVRNLSGSFKKSFDYHESKRLHQVQRWKAAFAEVGKLRGWHIKGGQSGRPEPDYIKEVVDFVVKKLTSSQSTSVSEELVGIDNQKKAILGLIEQKDSRIIGLWGMGGIGKTTLAEAVYMEVSTKFEDRCFLQNVSEKIEKQGTESLRYELLSRLLNEKEIRIDTPSIGYPYIERLNNKKVIVVLDDVTDSDQIDCMGVEHFGDESKIIVTSRDRQVLKNGGADKIYKVKKLNEKDSLQLFSTFAYMQLNPAAEFLHLSYKFVRYAGGSPLALKVLGSQLYKKSIKDWESEVNKLKEYTQPKISQILKRSFDRLDELEKNVFLDIACFFKGEEKKGVEDILSCLYKGAVCGISSLLDKCLLDITHLSKISMHDMLEEMGKDIVRQESKDPGKRSRLWNPKDVCPMLTNNKGTDLIEGIKLDMSRIDNLQLCSSVFKNMSNLRYIHFYISFHLRNGWNQKLHANGADIASLPNELRHLWWEYYPFKSLSPNFNPKNLVMLKLNHGNMEQLWNDDDYQDLVNLRKIDVSFSKNLRKIPKLLGAINLKSLDCTSCEGLVQLPCLTHLTSLKKLEIQKCCNLNKFPELPNDIGELNLSDTKIIQVPDSIEHLVRLEKLEFRNCPIVKFPKIPRSLELLDLSSTQIEQVSSSLDPLSNLQYLQMSDTRVKNVSSNILKLESLNSLDLSRCPIVEFPGIEGPLPILMFQRLEYLTMVDCKSLTLLSELPPDLKILNAHGCTSLRDVSFTDQNLHSFDGEGHYFKIFSNCFSLNQVSVDNIEANAMLNIQSLADKWASRHGQELSPILVPKLVCCYPGNEISAYRFKYQSMNSSLNLQISPSGSSMRRFLVFTICLVADLNRCYPIRNLEFICEYQLAAISGGGGGFDKFKSEVSLGRIYRTEQKCVGDHVLILCCKDMVREDKNYEEASFEFYINYFNEDKEEKIKVEKCGVHVFYMDAESYTITDVQEHEQTMTLIDF